MSERLTKKTNLNNLDGGKLYKVNADYSKCEDLDDREMVCAKVTSKIIDKLGPLEDLEEEYGDYIILVKALIQGKVFVKLKKGICRRNVHSLKYDNHFRLMIWKHRGVTLFEYGKLWALTKEELE